MILKKNETTHNFFCKLDQAIKMHWFSDSTAYNFFAMIIKKLHACLLLLFFGGWGGAFLVCLLKFPYIFILVVFFPKYSNGYGFF